VAENRSREENNNRFVDYPYDLRRDWNVDLQRRKLTALGAHVKPGERVLDVGCNSGHFIDFCPSGCEVHGVDLSPDLVERARTRLASAQVAPAESLPFPDRSFDVVNLAGVIEYVFDPNVVLRELIRVSRRLVIGTADHEDGIWGAHRVAGHEYMVRGYTAASLTELLLSTGRTSAINVLTDSDGKPQHYIWVVYCDGTVFGD